MRKNFINYRPPRGGSRPNSSMVAPVDGAAEMTFSSHLKKKLELNFFFKSYKNWKNSF